jgi:hypothetical protein
VAARSEVKVLIASMLRSWVQIPLKAWTFVLVFLFCVLLCREGVLPNVEHIVLSQQCGHFTHCRHNT